MFSIDYALLGLAVTHYRSLGYRYIEAPWCVDPEIADLTCRDRTRHATTQGRVLVGSAEQGMLQLQRESQIPHDTLLVACGPCFRNNEPATPLHHDHFMKVELGWRCADVNPTVVVERFIEDARQFMQRHSTNTVELIETTDGYDLTVSGIEVGSYGYRREKKWVYGTGLALPRFSQVTE